MKTKLSTKGFEEYLENIVQAGKDVDESAKRALLIGAEIIQEEMIELVPVETGNLRDHIKIKGPEQDGNYISVEIGIIHDIRYTDKRTAIYGTVQEYGSATNPAQPYIRPGITRARRKAMKAMKDSLIEDGAL